mgnify:CR=1 FL=1
MPDPIPSPGKAPLDVQVRAGDAAGTALQAALVGHIDGPLGHGVDPGRTEIQTWLLGAVPGTDLRIQNLQVRLCVYLKTVQEQLVFDLHRIFFSCFSL